MKITYCLIETTCSSKKLSNILAKSILEAKLAACVSISSEISSYYYFSGKLNKEKEYLIAIKSRSDKVDELIKFIEKNHSYSVPQIIKHNFDILSIAYKKWFNETL